jgi:hypothetical protein
VEVGHAGLVGRKKRGREGDGPRGFGPKGRGEEFGFVFFLSNPFPNLFQTFSQNFPTFSPIFLRLFHNYFKTFKTTPRPKLMHFNMMHKHSVDSNFIQNDI